MTADSRPWLRPAQNPNLLGHEKAEEILQRAFDSGRLPHAWLVTGHRGIGKATLAYRFTRFVLSGGRGDGQSSGELFGASGHTLRIDPEDPLFRRVASGGHRDLFTLERRADDKGKMASVIQVGEVRQAIQFVHMTSGEGGWRILIVDPVDELSRNAANALLKILEEPPSKVLLLLVSHAPGALLPTIASRCCRIALAPLPFDTVADLLRRALPDLAEEEVDALARLSDGSIGRAFQLWDAGGLDLYRNIIAILRSIPQIDVKQLHELGERLSRGADGAQFCLGLGLLTWWVARLVKSASLGTVPEEIAPGERDAAKRLLEGRSLAQWLELWDKFRSLAARSEAANLDRKQVIVTAFLELEALAG